MAVVLTMLGIACILTLRGCVWHVGGSCFASYVKIPWLGDVLFIDEAKIYVKAGDGGNGVVAFRREAHVPRGGPSGGNGGKGGDVYLVTDSQVNTLLAFSKQIHFRAANG
jgi:hypothetical protein